MEPEHHECQHTCSLTTRTLPWAYHSSTQHPRLPMKSTFPIQPQHLCGSKAAMQQAVKHLPFAATLISCSRRARFTGGSPPSAPAPRYPIVSITWVGLHIDSLESQGSLPIDSKGTIVSPTQVIMTTGYPSKTSMFCTSAMAFCFSQSSMPRELSDCISMCDVLRFNRRVDDQDTGCTCATCECGRFFAACDFGEMSLRSCASK